MHIDFYLDYRSPYAFLAATQLGQLGVEIVHKPLDVVAVMKAVNNQPSPLCPPKAKYALGDAMRWAKHYGVDFAPNRALLGALRAGVIDGALLPRVALAAQGLGVFEQANDALFRAVWASDVDLATEDGRAAFLDSHGLPKSLWDVAADPDIALKLASLNDEAAARGVFGVPTFFLGEEMFFGNDRLTFIKVQIDATRLAGAAA
ncbi:MAG: 2-hydroxychromene-2-carboxylate isomerase [Caulobacteraceae bacterium]